MGGLDYKLLVCQRATGEVVKEIQVARRSRVHIDAMLPHASGAAPDYL